MSNLAIVVARVAFYILQIVFGFLVLRSIDKIFSSMQNWNLQRVAAKKA